MLFKRGTACLFNALDDHRASCIPTAARTGVSDPRLMAFFAIELIKLKALTCGSPTCMSPMGCAVLRRGAKPPQIFGVVNMAGTRTFTCYVSAL